jgi:hypothetical protein
MPLSFIVAFAVVSLIGLTIAVVATVRAEARAGSGTSASFTYRAYGA